MSDEERYRVLKFSPEVFVQMLKEDKVLKTVEGLPNDAEPASYGYDVDSRLFYIYVESDEFDVVQEGEKLESIQPIVEEVELNDE